MGRQTLDFRQWKLPNLISRLGFLSWNFHICPNMSVCLYIKVYAANEKSGALPCSFVRFWPRLLP